MQETSAAVHLERNRLRAQVAELRRVVLPVLHRLAVTAADEGCPFCDGPFTDGTIHDEVCPTQRTAALFGMDGT